MTFAGLSWRTAASNFKFINSKLVDGDSGFLLSFNSKPHLLSCIASFSLLLRICSSGGLLSSLGYHADTMLRRYVATNKVGGFSRRPPVGTSYTYQTLDEFFDENPIGATGDSILVDTTGVLKNYYNVSVNYVALTYGYNSPYSPGRTVFYTINTPSGCRRFLDDVLDFRDYIDDDISVNYSYSNESGGTILSTTTNNAALIASLIFPLGPYFGQESIQSFSGSKGLFTTSFESAIDLEDCWYSYVEPVDHSYLVAYHQICSQFFTVDAIDDIYTSKMWMENMSAIAQSIRGNATFPYFSYNGISITYDVFSRNVIKYLVDRFINLSVIFFLLIPV